MVEEDIVVHSTVVLPEVIEKSETSLTQTNKRRASSASSSASKRQRLDSNESLPAEIKTKRSTADTDERKRGKRLFGGLLGTLSQNSSSTAQKRRVDIERKQREKLKAQQEEDEEAKRHRQEGIDAARRAKQKIWDAESRRTRLDSERALARFLKTRTLPVLYYKPWELLTEEEDLIKQQVEEAERKLKKMESETQYSSQDPDDTHSKEQQPDRQPIEDINMVEKVDEPPDGGPDKAETSDTPHLSNGHLPAADDIENDGKAEDPTKPGRSPKQDDLAANENHASPDATKDDMEGVVQGDEDAVLY